MRNILEAPQSIHDDCPNHPRLATAYWRLFLLLLPNMAVTIMLVATNPSSRLTYAMIIGTGTLSIGYCLVTIGIMAVRAWSNPDAKRKHH